jgi:hypothetical protein
MELIGIEWTRLDLKQLDLGSSIARCAGSSPVPGIYHCLPWIARNLLDFQKVGTENQFTHVFVRFTYTASKCGQLPILLRGPLRGKRRPYPG